MFPIVYITCTALPLPKKKRNFDTKLRFFFFAQNPLNKGFYKKEKFLNKTYNKKKTPCLLHKIHIAIHYETYLFENVPRNVL